MSARDSALSRAYSPLNLDNRSLAFKLAAVVFGTIFLAASSYVEVPMIPVPVTMQTFAVAMVGALYGWRLGAITIIAWLLEGAMGLPVLAGGASGPVHFVGPTGGYLFAFPIAGALTGWLAQRGWNGHRAGLAFCAMLACNLLCLVLGAAWLATIVGMQAAVISGIVPFLVGAVLKAALGAASLKGLTRFTEGKGA